MINILRIFSLSRNFMGGKRILHRFVISFRILARSYVGIFFVQARRRFSRWVAPGFFFAVAETDRSRRRHIGPYS